MNDETQNPMGEETTPEVENTEETTPEVGEVEGEATPSSEEIA